MKVLEEGWNSHLSTDERLLMALQETGPQTIDDLCSLPGMGWSQVFLAIDRLSRSGRICLGLVDGRHYRVSINTAT